MILSEVPKELHNFLNRDFVVVGIGNEIRGDDGVGVYIVKEAGKVFSDKFINAGMAIENYVFKLTGFSQKRILLIDSVDFGKTPETFFLRKRAKKLCCLEYRERVRR